MSHYLTRANLTKLKSLRRRYTPKGLYFKVREKLAAPYQDYEDNLHSYLPAPEELKQQRGARFHDTPLVSIVVPTYETPKQFLCQMIDSVAAQTYPNWELCIADGSPGTGVEQIIAEHYSQEARIKYKRLDRNGGISENTNQGFAFAFGEYVALLDHDDLLVPSALYEMVRRINETGADFLYSDEDKVSADLSRYMEPHFKLSFNRELLLGNNYICHFLVVKRELLEQAGGLDSRYDGAQDFDFVLRLSELAKRVEHIPKILYHWRMHSGSTAGNTDSKLYAYEAGKRAVEACMQRRGWNGTVTMDSDLGFYRIQYQIPEGVTVSVCAWPEPKQENPVNIPARLRKDIEQQLSSCRANVLWDYQPGQEADYVLVLNQTVKEIREGSIKALLGSCARPNIGMVGGKTVSHGKVCQCGYWDKNGSPEPRFAGLPRHFKGYFRRAFLPVEVDMVSADLAVISRAAVSAVINGQADSAAVDYEQPMKYVGQTPGWQTLCRQLKTSGYRIIVEPQAEVIVRD